MISKQAVLHLLLMGAGSRLFVASFVILLLWAAFFWSTSSLGAL